MNFLIEANTDVGLVKSTNQDSLDLKILHTPQGDIAFGILCDGMGGLASGEIASAAVIRAFDKWIHTGFFELCKKNIEDYMIREQWQSLVDHMNQSIKNYGSRSGVKMGTTVTAILLTEKRYYILNIGDSRIYEICEDAKQMTKDQTVVAREVALGNMTEEEARYDTRRNVLLQCVGASENVYPEFVFGETKKNAVYMLCSDGFRHEVSKEEFFQEFQPENMTNKTVMFQKITELIERNKQRGESDNITAALIRTF